MCYTNKSVAVIKSLITKCSAHTVKNTRNDSWDLRKLI